MLDFTCLQLPRLPMINGPTLTTTVTALNKYDRFGERLVLAQVLGIHFGRTRKEETEKILEGLKRREPEARSVSYNSVAKLAMKPYPGHSSRGQRLSALLYESAGSERTESAVDVGSTFLDGSWIIPGLSIELYDAK